MNKTIFNFLNAFETEWKIFIENITHEIDVNQSQLYCGNRLRPQLVFWGYYLGCEYNNHLYNEDELVKTSIPFEAVHKSSIIIDDIIDNDNYRKGQYSFHTQFGLNNSLIYTILLLTNAIKYMEQNKPFILDNGNIITSIINTMCRGAMLEINLKNNYQYIKETLSIIRNETVELIKQCFSSGFKLADPNNKNIIKIIDEVGDLIGFNFQMLNDAEPFFNPEYIRQHKKSLNYDINNYGKKNYIIAYLYGICSLREAKSFESISYDELIALLKKYRIKDEILNIIKERNNYIIKQISKLNIPSVIEFIEYYNNAFNIAIIRALGE